MLNTDLLGINIDRDPYNVLLQKISKLLIKEGFTRIHLQRYSGSDVPVILTAVFYDQPPRNLIKIQAKVKRMSKTFGLQPLDLTVVQDEEMWRLIIRFKPRIKRKKNLLKNATKFLRQRIRI